MVLWTTTCSFMLSTIHGWFLRVNVPDSAWTTSGHTSRKAAPPERCQTMPKPSLCVSASGVSCSSPGAQRELHGWSATWWDLGWLHAEKHGHLCLATFSRSQLAQACVCEKSSALPDTCLTRVWHVSDVCVVSASSRRRCSSSRTVQTPLSRVSGRQW